MKKSLAIIWVRTDGKLHEDSSIAGGEKWCNFRYTRTKLDFLKVGCEV